MGGERAANLGMGRSETPEANARLRAAIQQALAGDGAPALEAAATELVGQLRGSNMPPEKMLVRIKEILGECGLRPSQASPSPNDHTSPAALYRDLIALSVRVYYDGDHDGPPRSDQAGPP